MSAAVRGLGHTSPDGWGSGPTRPVRAHGRVMSISATLQFWTETIGLLLGGVTLATLGVRPGALALAGVALAAGLIGMTIVSARPGGDVSRVT